MGNLGKRNEDVTWMEVRERVKRVRVTKDENEKSTQLSLKGQRQRGRDRELREGGQRE